MLTRRTQTHTHTPAHMHIRVSYLSLVLFQFGSGCVSLCGRFCSCHFSLSRISHTFYYLLAFVLLKCDLLRRHIHGMKQFSCATTVCQKHNLRKILSLSLPVSLCLLWQRKKRKIIDTLAHRQHRTRCSLILSVCTERKFFVRLMQMKNPHAHGWLKWMSYD